MIVFFRAPQDDLTVEEQKHVTYMLGKLTGRPEGHGLHVHPLYNDPNNLPMADGTTDPNMYVFLMSGWRSPISYTAKKNPK